MHLLVEKSVRIYRPVPEVFEYVSDMERFAEWFPGVIAIQALDGPGPGLPGQEYLETVRVPLRGLRQVTLQVREARAPHFFATEGRLRPLLPRMEISVGEAGADSCEVTWRMFSRSGSPVVHYLLLPLARRVMGARAGLGLAALKRRVEAAGSAASAVPPALVVQRTAP